MTTEKETMTITSKDVATVESSGLVKPEPAQVPATIDLGDGDSVHGWASRPPFLRLIQKDTAGTPGTWLRSDTQEEYDEVQIVPLRLMPTRRKWPQGEFSQDRGIECWSDDGLHAATGAKYEGTACADCQFRRDNIFQMTPDEDARGGACAPTHMAIVLMAYTWEPVALNLGNKTLSRMVGALKANLRKNILTFNAPLFKGEKGGEWYSPRLSGRPEPLTDEDKQEVAQSFARMMGVRVSVVSEQAEDESPTDTVAAPPAAPTDHTDKPQQQGVQTPQQPAMGVEVDYSSGNLPF